MEYDNYDEFEREEMWVECECDCYRSLSAVDDLNGVPDDIRTAAVTL